MRLKNSVDYRIGGVFDVNMDKLIGALLPTDEDMAQQKEQSKILKRQLLKTDSKSLLQDADQFCPETEIIDKKGE